MPYSRFVHTVVETPEYLAAAKRAGIGGAERERILDVIARDPDAGVLIPGTGGARKVRIAKEGGGKSAGYRVITYFSQVNRPALLVTVISKGKQADLSQAQRNELRKDKGL